MKDGDEICLCSAVELHSRVAPYPQRCVLLPHCQTAAFSGFSLDWFSGYQQEEDSFVPAVHPLHEGLGLTWLNANRRALRITANLSGLTWEDTTASERQDSNLQPAPILPFELLLRRLDSNQHEGRLYRLSYVLKCGLVTVNRTPTVFVVTFVLRSSDDSALQALPPSRSRRIRTFVF